MKFWKTVAVIGGSYFLAEWVNDRFIIKSDSADPTGFIVQSEGLGLDDGVRLLTIGLVSAFALRAFKVVS